MHIDNIVMFFPDSSTGGALYRHRRGQVRIPAGIKCIDQIHSFLSAFQIQENSLY